ncbi:MAG TPA: outer membrane beta-barrel protein, partial [Chitinophagaceae bacterium]|nr:outer membrane beta-barrel protein [Chitinophagaceae bacterium]
TQNAGITYRIGDRDNQFSVGVNYQHSSLKSDQVFPDITQVRKSFSDILPNIQLRRKLSPRSNIRIFYRGSVNAPSVTQLQNVIDNSNQLRMSTGNPQLNQQYMHILSGRYAFTNTKLGQSFFANLFLQKANNYLANATFTATADSILVPGITLFKGSQLTKPVNLDGYWSLRSFFTYGQPVKFIKSNLNLNAGFSYSRIPGLVNSVNTTSKSFNYSYGAVIASNISEYVDFNISYTGNYNVVKNSLQPQLNQNYRTAVAGLQMNLLTKTGWFFQNDLNYQSYNGLSEGFNQNFWLWNAGIGKKFLKNNKGELKLSVFDLLKQNQSISRTVGDSYIQDVQNLVLQQYFMLTFTYNLKNFGKAPVSNNQRQRN